MASLSVVLLHWCRRNLAVSLHILLYQWLDLTPSNQHLYSPRNPKIGYRAVGIHDRFIACACNNIEKPGIPPCSILNGVAMVCILVFMLCMRQQFPYMQLGYLLIIFLCSGVEPIDSTDQVGTYWTHDYSNASIYSPPAFLFRVPWSAHVTSPITSAVDSNDNATPSFT